MSRSFGRRLLFIFVAVSAIDVCTGPQANPSFSATIEDASLTPENLLHSCILGGEYLLRGQQPDGDFNYRYRADTDRDLSGYNLLRHAGTCYALLQLYEVTKDDRYRDSADRALASLMKRARPPREEDRDVDFLAIVSSGDKAKLGGAALTLLAMTKYQQVTGDPKWLPQAKKLTRFILFCQEESGHFHSRYWYKKENSYDDWDSEYYPGESILALVRLYELEPDEKWLEAAKKGAYWLIGVRDAGVEVKDLPHDHWLLMALHELYTLTGGKSFLRQSQKIASGILSAQRRSSPNPAWIGTFYTPPRCAPVATRGEGIVAACDLAEMVGLPTAPYLESLKLMAQFLLRCQITQETAAALPNPEKALGGFRGRLDDGEVRIDYVQHSMSMLLGLRRLLQEPGG